MGNYEKKMGMAESIIAGMAQSVLGNDRSGTKRKTAVYAEPEDDGKINPRQIADFVSGVREAIDEFLDNNYENEDEELYEYDDSIECDADDYNDDGFEHRYEAQNACRDALESAIDDVTSAYESEREDLIGATWNYYGGCIENANQFYAALSSSCETMLDIYTSGTTKQYLTGKTEEFLSGLTEEKGMTLVPDLFEKTFDELIEKHFGSAEKKIINFKELFGECEIEEDGDGYCFSIDGACDTLCESYGELLEREADDFPEDVLSGIKELEHNFFSAVTDWLDGLDDAKDEVGE